MSTQIAVRLPDELVSYVDALVSDGAGSRATVITRALKIYQQQLRAEADARILEATGDYDEFDALIAHASVDE
ncbi:hypothetical protein F0U44_20040 [Nocardioides humilatus]|uniref:Ribbon-helix-helix protein, CopG family n=1 Tax=Nocardioides humilatus TaxID=2607660 RepID=A0A5B1L661_9ACTN|nr:hypothetical protein [Nocardioides humilatus]KAA1415926.1 hypothetical protein F0U44_20040 [Nocardioides humilatus]